MYGTAVWNQGVIVYAALFPNGEFNATFVLQPEWNLLL
jgi:hypothetical protein